MSNVAVLDIGKTNVKLSAATRDGALLETVSTANVTRDGPPYRHPDLAGIEDWLFRELPPWPGAIPSALSSPAGTARRACSSARAVRSCR